MAGRAGDYPRGPAIGQQGEASNAENPYAGQGSVLLDIGGDVGALVVIMPAALAGAEVEIRPAPTAAAGRTNRMDQTITPACRRGGPAGGRRADPLAGVS